jgi:hypothetical protein
MSKYYIDDSVDFNDAAISSDAFAALENYEQIARAYAHMIRGTASELVIRLAPDGALAAELTVTSPSGGQAVFSMLIPKGEWQFV